MFDFGFSELMVIGAVALVVLGPERLPTVARTAGEWLGKAQRLVQQVKSDIEREAELSELKKIQQEAQNVADDLNKTVKGQVNQINSEIKDLESSVNADKYTAFVSVTARTFFENRGYTVARENTAVRSGVALKNFLMEKRRIYRTDVY